MATEQTKSDKTRYVCQLTLWAVFWVWGTFGFLADDVFRQLQPMRPMLMLVLDAIIALMACVMVRRLWAWVCIAVFMGLSWLATCMLNHEVTLFWVNGMREFIGLLMIYPIVLFIMDEPKSRERFLDSFDRQGLYFIMVQCFCIIVQWFMYGAGDLVGGGYGHYYSGQVSVTIYLISFALIRRRIDYDHFVKSLGENKIYILLLLPTFLNETKVSFVMLGLYFLLLAPIDRKLLMRLMIVVPLLALLTTVGLAVYNYTTELSQSGTNFNSLEDAVAYFVLDDLEKVEGDARWNIENNHGRADVPRLSKLMYLAVLNEQEPGHVIAGFGVGQFKGGTQMAQSDFAREYDWLLMGSIPYVFHVYIQMGVLGLLMFVCYAVFLAWKRPRGTQRDVNLQLMLLAVALLVCLYNDMFRNLAFCILFFTLLSSSWTRPTSHPKEGEATFSTSVQHGLKF